MNRRLVRRVAFCLIALLGFAQGTVTLAACTMERGAPMQMSPAGETSGCDEPAGTVANVCVAHCTADLQVAGTAAVLVQVPGKAQALLVPLRIEYWSGRMALEVPPPQTVPSRILLHSFLI